MNNFLFGLLVVWLIVTIFLVVNLIKHKLYDGKMQVDTQRDIYRVVIYDLDSLANKKEITLQIEKRSLSSLKED